MYRLTPISHTIKTLGLNDWMDDFMKPTSFRLDVNKKDHVYHVVAELPGFNKDDIQISYEKDTLIITASVNQEHQDEKDDWIHKERSHRSMKRSLYLPDLDEAAIKAKLKDGLLMVEAPIQTSVASNIPIIIE
jgi:HSP20 family protein